MDFFENQERARRHTKLLIVYFGLAVATLIVTAYLAAALILFHSRVEHGQGLIALWDPQVFLAVATGTIAIVSFGSLYKIMELRAGGGAVARMMGGRLVSPSPTDPDEKKLRNVIEEMALASGVPVPEIYVIDEESGINAFAAGYGTPDAAVTVTRGCMQLLSRDELQGVIGHEFSHILNGDMRLNIRLMGLINGILCLAIVGRILLNTSSSRRSNDDRKGGNPLPLFGLALLAIGGIGVFFGRLIQSAVSRQREFLADASAVQFTRNPLGLAGALKKIGGLGEGSEMHSAEASGASHMFFANGLRESWFNLFATHPPLEERIRLLDPSFDGKFEPVIVPPREIERAEGFAEDQLPIFGRVAPPPIRHTTMSALYAQKVRPGQMTSRAGSFTPKHLAYAAEVRSALPESLVTTARNPFGAVSLVYGVLLSTDSATRVAQLEQLKSTCEPGILAEIARIDQTLQTLPPEAKLPLFSIALPSLRSLSPAQFENLKANIDRLIKTDGNVDLEEYALQKLLLRNLEPHFTKQARPIIQYYAWQPLLGDAAIILSAMSYAGQDTPEAAANAFEIGWQELRSQESCSLIALGDLDLSQLDTALDRLSKASPFIRKSMINAAAFTVAADEVICPAEAELLRAIADVLECPLPPFIEGI